MTKSVALSSPSFLFPSFYPSAEFCFLIVDQEPSKCSNVEDRHRPDAFLPSSRSNEEEKRAQNVSYDFDVCLDKIKYQ